MEKILEQAWNRLNPSRSSRHLSRGRLLVKSKLEPGFFDQQLANVIRVEVNWLVDGAEPNPIFFRAPRLDDLLAHFANASALVYQGIPLISDQLTLGPVYNHTQHKDLLRFAILSSWVKANPELRDNIFFVTVDDQALDNSTSRLKYRRGLIAANLARIASSDQTESKTIRYFVGVNEHDFDVSEVQKPSADMLQAEIKQHLPSLALFDTKTVDSTKDDRNRHNSKANFVVRSLSFSFSLIKTKKVFSISNCSFLFISGKHQIHYRLYSGLIICYYSIGGVGRCVY